MLRLFVGIEFPPELKLRLSLLQSGIVGARWVDPGNFHLTLRFIGEIDEGTAADVDEALLTLQGKIELALMRIGLPPEPRKFTPHVTLARLRDPRRLELQEFLAAHA